MISLVGVWAAYLTVRAGPGFVGPAVLTHSRGTLSYVSLHSPGWMVLNSSFNGRGRVVVSDQFSNETVFVSGVSEHLHYPIVIPREGSYAIYTLNGSLTFSGHYCGVYPAVKVQRVLYGSIVILAFFLALWRWRS